jgi:hypothetical protein
LSKTASKYFILLLLIGLLPAPSYAVMEPAFEFKALGDSFFLPVSRGKNNGQLHGRFKAKNFEYSMLGTEEEKTHKFYLDVGAGGLMGRSIESYIIMPQAYYKFRNASNNLQFTAGRVIRDYSDVDQYWLLGDVQPVFRWDVSRPEQQGLSGLFLDLKANKNLSFSVYGSPVFLPSQGASYSIVSGKVTSSNPWFKPPVDILSISGVPYDLSYTIDTPSYSDIVFQPAFGAGFTLNNDDGSLFIRANYFNKIKNDLVLPFEGSVNIATLKGDIKVHPVAARHQMSTLDLGYKGEKFQATVSGIYESSVKYKAKDPWIYPHYSDQYKVALHLTALINPTNTVEVGALKTFNNKVVVQGLTGTGSIDIYSYRNQYDDVIDARWTAGFAARPYGYLFKTKMRYAYDYEARTSLVSFEASYLPLEQLTLFALADFFGGQKPTGTGYNNLMTDYLNNDRAQAGVRYVF